MRPSLQISERAPFYIIVSTMNISSLIENGLLIPIGESISSFSSPSLDSRKTEKGGLFIAIPGQQQEGASFIEDAFHQGAHGIVVPSGQGRHFKETYPDLSVFETLNIRKTASILASHFYPLQPDTVVAVTGTNGKTSVVSFMSQMWHLLGKPAASLGTLGLRLEGGPFPLRLEQTALTPLTPLLFIPFLLI